jgi:hypothetical protein
LTNTKETTMITHDQRWSHPRGNTPVPSRWQATADGTWDRIRMVDAVVTAL